MNSNQEVWDMDAACAALQASDRTIRRKIKEGELLGKKRNGRWEIKPIAAPLESTNSSISNPHQTQKELPIQKPPANESVVPSAVASTKPIQRPSPKIENQSQGSCGLDLEPLESLIEIKRIGAWRKIMQTYECLSDPQMKEECQNAAGYLVEGFLAIGSRKQDAYIRCRGCLAKLLVRLQLTGCGPQPVKVCHEALNAVQSLVIRYSKKKGRDDRDYH